MKTTLILTVAFGIGIVASNNTIHRNAGGGPMQSVFRFDELEEQRVEEQQAYLSFLNVDSLHCGVYSLAAGAIDGQQPHTEDEIYFVQQGNAKIEISGQDYDLQPGSIVFVPAFAKHRFHSIEEDLKTLVIFSKVKIEKPADQ